MLILIVSEGPDKGRIYEWSDDQTIIVGRESKDLRLSDGKSSRQHARFKCEGGTWSVRDLASRHGTLVNGIRTQGKTPLRDGDRVRLGRTELVVARMPAEQAERAALLGDQPSRGEVWRDMPKTRWYIPRASTAAGFAAAAFAIGCSAYLYMNLSNVSTTIRDDVRSASAAQQSATEAQLAAVDAQTKATESQLALADRTDEIYNEVASLNSSSTPVLKEILASVQSQKGNGVLLNDIQTALAEMHNSSMTTLDTILASMESQSDQWQALAKVEDTMQNQQDQAALLLPELQAVASTAQANEKALNALRQQIELAQARPDLDADILDQLEAIVTELQARPTADQVASQVRTALAQEQEKTNELLVRIESQLSGNPDTQALITPLREALAEQSDATEQMISQAFARQDKTDKQLEQLSTLIRAQPSETAAAVDAVLGKLTTQDDINEVLAAVKQIETGGQSPESVKLLNDLALKLQTAPSSQELADSVVKAVTEELNTTRPLLEQIASSLDNATQQSDTSQELIEQLRLALLAQEAADTRLDQIYDMLAKADLGEDSDAMRQVLREIRSKSITGMDEMRSTIRREIQAGLTDTRLAGGATSGPEPVIASKPIADEPQPLYEEPINSNIHALAAEDTQPQVDVSVKKDGLTDVEHAYRLAFKTGKPITLGGGGIDPATGKVKEGRVIDPASAKAAGITDWRDWYLMDDFAERMRLQQQAIQYHDNNRTAPLSIPADAKATQPLDKADNGG